MEENPNSRIISKPKEKRAVYQSNESETKRHSKSQVSYKNDGLPPVSAQFNECTSPVKKVLFEANKIVKIGMAKEFALFEKDATIQSSNETIDNLRKNILQLQMEYEKLDQNCHNEISYRTEIVKRMETTRSIVESTAQCSNTLLKSLKQLEEDKFKIAEFYEMLHQKQKDIEEKHKEVVKLMRNMDEVISKKFEEIKKSQQKTNTQNTEIIAEITKKLSWANEQLEITSSEKENLLMNVNDCNITIKNLNDTLAKKENIVNLQLRSIKTLQKSIKRLKIKNSIQRESLKNKTKQFLSIKSKYSQMVQNFMTIESSYRHSTCSNEALQAEKKEIKSDLENLQTLFQTKEKEWEEIKEGLMRTVTEKEAKNEQLVEKSEKLNEKLLEFEKGNLELQMKEQSDKLNFDKLQEKYLKTLNENETLIQNNKKLSEENMEKSHLVLDFQSKLNFYDSDFKSKKTTYENELQHYESLVKRLEANIKTLQEKLSSEGEENKKLIAKCDGNQKAHELINDKITLLEEQLKEKTSRIEELKTEKEEKSTAIQSLKNEVNNLRSTESQKRDIMAKLKTDVSEMKEKNEKLNRDIKDEKQINENLLKQLENAGNNISDLKKKLEEECSAKKTLKANIAELQKTTAGLKKDLTLEKKSVTQLNQTNLELEKKLDEMTSVLTENSSLKSSVKTIEGRLEGSEARVEALKIIVKKLETEKLEYKENHSQEISKLQLELKTLKDTLNKREFPKTLDPFHRSFQEFSDKETDPSGVKKVAGLGESVKLHKVDEKENDISFGEANKIHNGSLTPLQSKKKYLSTPRKILTSTPQHRLHNMTPVKNKRDPYEFDSDESLDVDQIHKVTKKEQTKRAKSNY